MKNSVENIRQMKRITLMLLAVVMLPLAMAGKDDKNREGIVAMSFNIRYSEAEDGTNSWQYRYPATAMMIDDQKPDVIGLQEALYEQFTYLKTAFDKSYSLIGVGREDGRKKGEMAAIMYNKNTTTVSKWGTFWLSDTPDTPSLGWDGACFRCATWAVMKDKASGKKYLVVNTHLDHQGVEAQKNGVKLIVSKLAEINPDGLPVILTGDFNMEAGNPALMPLQNLMNNARTMAVVTDDHYSYNGWGKAQGTIDFVWYKDFTCTKFETVTKPYYERNFISDHYPVKATLIF